MDKTLAELADELNGRINEFEDLLQGMNLGVTAEVAMDTQTKLVFYKGRDNFRLAVRGVGVDGIPLSTKGEVLLVHCSREVRIRAVGFFFELYEALTCSAERERRRLTGAIGNLDSIIGRVKEMKSG